MISLVLAESALELVPNEIAKNPSVKSDAKRRGKGASEILLDRSFHHSGMLKLKDSEKRGRPDLVHVALLSVTGTPLYLDGLIRVFVHTYQGTVIEIAPKTRIPKNYLRFRGLMEETLVERPVKGLLTVRTMRIKQLGKEAKADEIFGLSVQGRMSDPEALALEISKNDSPMLVVGGFPHGHFSEETATTLDQLVRIDSAPLEAHVVVSRVVYEAEKLQRRLND